MKSRESGNCKVEEDCDIFPEVNMVKQCCNCGMVRVTRIPG